MNKFNTGIAVFIIALGLFVKSISSVLADAPDWSGTISATYNQTTGQLNTSGSYSWNKCDDKNKNKKIGFALFINNGTPETNNSNALDGAGMHLANGGDPCTTTPGNWSDNSHILAEAPENVCVVLYDVEEKADKGKHSQIGAGSDYNDDNSWNENSPKKTYSESSCIKPSIVIDPTPSPTPTPTETPTVSPSCSVDQHLDAAGKNCVSWSQSNPPENNSSSSSSNSAPAGQVLGASTMAKTGSFAENLNLAIMALGGTLSAFGIKNFKKNYKKA